jgi:hypothetical protein
MTYEKIKKKNSKLLKKKYGKYQIYVIPHTCQGETISCGVYVCFFVEKLVKRQEELLNDHVYTNEYRNFIKDFLINSFLYYNHSFFLIVCLINYIFYMYIFYFKFD